MAKEKIKIDTPDSQFPFIPPVSEFMGWLGGPEGLHTSLHRVQKTLDQPTPNLKTLRTACEVGATPRTVEIVKKNLYAAARQVHFAGPLEKFIPTKPMVSGTNGAKWLLSAKGLIEGMKPYQMIPELPYTFAFLERRSDAESQLIMSSYDAINTAISRKERIDRIRRAFCETCQSQTQFTKKEIQVYGDTIIGTNFPQSSKTLELLANALKCSFHLRLDFYHQLLSNLMLDMLSIREILRLPPMLDDALKSHGAMSQLTPLLEQGKLITPTYRIYELWSKAFTFPSEPLSYRAMALHLPQPNVSRTRVQDDADLQDILDASNESRYSKIKEWRSGTVPETAALTMFLESLSGQCHGAFLPFIMTRAATAWTKWLEYEQSNLNMLIQKTPALQDHLQFGWIIDKFSTFPDYWLYAMAQAYPYSPEP